MRRYFVRPCPMCRRRRRIYLAGVTTTRQHTELQNWRCSQGHTWQSLLPTIALFDRAWKASGITEMIREQLDAPSVLLAFFMEQR